jgi:hypothetical protein
VLPIPAAPDDKQNEIPIETIESNNGENEVNEGPDEVPVPEQSTQPDLLEGRRYPLRAQHAKFIHISIHNNCMQHTIKQTSRLIHTYRKSCQESKLI